AARALRVFAGRSELRSDAAVSRAARAREPPRRDRADGVASEPAAAQAGALRQAARAPQFALARSRGRRRPDRLAADRDRAFAAVATAATARGSKTGWRARP